MIYYNYTLHGITQTGTYLCIEGLDYTDRMGIIDFIDGLTLSIAEYGI